MNKLMPPRGFHAYTARGVVAGNVDATIAAARKLKRARIGTVWLCAEAVDGWRPTEQNVRRAVDVFTDVANIRVGLYSFPGTKALRDPVASAMHLVELAQKCRVGHMQLDAERPFWDRPEAAREYRKAMSPFQCNIGASISTLGIPGAPDRFPWDEFLGWGWLSWQVYERSASHGRVRHGLDLMRTSWGKGHVLPAIATYKRDTKKPEGQDGPLRLRNDLMRACLQDMSDIGSVDVPGALLWSVESMDSAEVEAVASLAATWGWG